MDRRTGWLQVLLNDILTAFASGEVIKTDLHTPKLLSFLSFTGFDSYSVPRHQPRLFSLHILMNICEMNVTDYTWTVVEDLFYVSLTANIKDLSENVCFKHINLRHKYLCIIIGYRYI